MFDEQRITELEFRITHLEGTIQTLSDELANQARHHNALVDAFNGLQDRFTHLLESDDSGEEPPPPHY